MFIKTFTEVLAGIGLKNLQHIESEKALKAKEEKYHSLLNNIMEGVVILDFTGHILFTNPAVSHILGYADSDNAQFVKRKMTDYLHPDSVPDAFRDLALVSLGINPLVEYRIFRKDGSIGWIEARGTKIEFEGQETDMVLCHDITERKLTEDALRESERRLKKAQELASVGNWELDIKTQKIWASEQAYHIYGFNSDTHEITLKLVQSVTVEKYRKMLDEALVRLFLEGGTYSQEFQIMRASDGEIRDIHSVGELLTDENNKPVKVLGVLQDITARKKVEMEMLAAKEKAEESDRLKSAFLANMSHEIRTPMNGIIGFASLLNEPDISPEERHKFTRIITENCDQLLHIINDLIDIAKIEAGQVDLINTEFDLDTLMDSIHRTFLPKAGKKGIGFTVEKETVEKVNLVTADQTKLRQILDNLVSNALKYTYNGYVKFGYHKTENLIQFFVQDTGIGIDPGNFELIFDRFRQVHEKTSTQTGGNGLGLSITRAYVTAMGGHIWLESEPGKGSAFYFTIPMGAAKERKEKPYPMKIQHAQNKNTQTVLVVEDVAENFEFIQLLLNRASHKVLHAWNGTEALELFNAHPEINLVMLDIKLPDMNGYDVAKKMREINNHISIIAQTAYAMAEDRENSFAAGCVDYISKPMRKEDIFRIVNKYLSGMKD